MVDGMVEGEMVGPAVGPVLWGNIGKGNGLELELNKIDRSNLD